jgi:hypothetical protein
VTAAYDPRHDWAVEDVEAVTVELSPAEVVAVEVRRRRVVAVFADVVDSSL